MKNKQQHISPKIQINIDELEEFTCPACEGTEFDIIYLLKKVPAMLSPNGKETMGPVAYFRCVSCLKRTSIMKLG